ncbi:LysR family transcriptional regulator [Streptomyces sp. NPDC086766]|uniref:LysR family transcriptional regulator n=1 Tax=Streptomyces sp. NPDC086766 TaxID=3365754 RepID=UPI0037F7507C
MSRDGGTTAAEAPGGSGRRNPTAHQLRLFLMLSEELHFGRAAARLFMAQPALSQQIRTLEDRLGTALFARAGQGVHLTACGQALVVHAQEAIRALDRVRATAETFARELRGHLVIGAIGAEAATPHAHAILAEMRRQHPHIIVEIRSVGFVTQIEALARGDVDAAFLRPPLPSGLRNLPLAMEPRVACLPAGDPLAVKERIHIAELAGHPVVDVPPEVPRAWRDGWALNPRPDGTPVRFGPEAADIEAVLLAVAAGRGMTFLPSSARHLYPRPGIAYVDVADIPPSTSALAWIPGGNRPLLNAFVATASNTVASTHSGCASADRESRK